MMENVTKFKAALAAVLAAMTALWGWVGWLVLAGVGCMAIDYITGLPASIDKYSRGSVLVVAGSASYPGAAMMAAKAAARSRQVAQRPQGASPPS